MPTDQIADFCRGSLDTRIIESWAPSFHQLLRHLARLPALLGADREEVMAWTPSSNNSKAPCAPTDLNPPEIIEPGKLHRFPTNGKRHDDAGWCKLFPDGQGGVFGNFRSGLSETWQVKREKPFTSAEREAFRQRCEAERRAREAEEAHRHAEAREKAAAILEGATGDPAAHPYAIKKRVPLGPLVKRGPWPQRGWSDALLLPIYGGDGRLWSIEAINADGSKDSLKGALKRGGFHPFGKVRGASRVLIAEGLANAAIGCAVGGLPAAAAMGKSNLLHAALAVRKLAPEAEIIILADNDLNVPREAQDAALAVGGRVAIPEGRKCDFWDLWHERGVEAVQRAIAGAKAPGGGEYGPAPGTAPGGFCGGEEWPEPQPLTVKVTPEPYPLDALPHTIRAAVEEVQAFAKAPVPLVASSALAALSIAAQAYIDVKRAERLSGPVGLFLLTIADSGERKSTCDGFFTKAIREYEEAQAETAKPVLEDLQGENCGMGSQAHRHQG